VLARQVAAVRDQAADRLHGALTEAPPTSAVAVSSGASPRPDEACRWWLGLAGSGRMIKRGTMCSFMQPHVRPGWPLRAGFVRPEPCHDVTADCC
jgi:hypothetical protein